MEREPAVYILASQKRGRLYVGVTSLPVGRIMQHRDELIEGFTTRHGVKRLVLIERADTMDIAITREKQLKNWHRAWKINLIEAGNPTWRDLALDFGLPPLCAPRSTR
jgi:putative endonuclease